MEIKRLQHGAEIGARSEKILAELRKSHIDVKKELATEKAKMARLRDGGLSTKLYLQKDKSSFYSISLMHAMSMKAGDIVEESNLGRRIR